MLGTVLPRPRGVRGVPVLAPQEAADVLARQYRFELAQLVGVEFVDLDPVFAPQRPGEAILCETFGGAVDVEMPQPMDEILSAGRADQRPQGVESRADQRAQGPRLDAHLFRRSRTDKADEPRSDRRQIAPTQR